MLNTLRNALLVPEIRKRVGFVFFAFAVFVFMIHVQLPNVDQAKWQAVISSGAFYQFLGFLSGGALQKLSIIAMGITPYINASIIMQLMTVVIPQLEEMAKKGGQLPTGLKFRDVLFSATAREALGAVGADFGDAS